MHGHILDRGEESKSMESAYEAQSHIPGNNLEIHTEDDRYDPCPIEEAYKLRRKRAELFEAELFNDPAWDILLDLYVAERVRKNIPITSSCIASNVPASTGSRWIALLIQNGYIQQHDDPADARRSFISLTSAARAKLEILFGKVDEADC